MLALVERPPPNPIRLAAVSSHGRLAAWWLAATLAFVVVAVAFEAVAVVVVVVALRRQRLGRTGVVVGVVGRKKNPLQWW